MTPNERQLLSNMIRAKRNSLLEWSDWTQLTDSPVDKATWAVYRQSLRDITIQDNFPISVNWPEVPANSKIPLDKL